MKILNFGSANIDYLYEVSHFVKPGETIKSSNLTINCGGKGLNQSIAMKNAGLNVYHAGMVGKNDGDLLINFLNEYKINTNYIKKVNGLSGHAIIQVSNEGENSIILNSGSNCKITQQYVDSILDNFEKDDFIILQNEISCVDYIIKQAHKRGLCVIFNPSPCTKEISSYSIELVDYFILNEIEGEQITGKTDKDDIINSLIIKYPNSKFILTLGKDGSIYKDKNLEYSSDIYSVPVVDTTAAGDTFTGYFIYSIINNLPISKGLMLASAASALAVSKKGAAISIPYYKDVISFMETYKT